MTFARDHFKNLRCSVVSYLATVKKRTPSALRKDGKMVLLGLYAYDCSITVDQCISFFDSKGCNGDMFQCFWSLRLEVLSMDVSYLSTKKLA
jgi:hypothetical protein